MLREIAISCVLASFPALAGVGIYLQASPSLPLAQDWLDYVDEYPALELGVSALITGPKPFDWRLEGAYASFPEAGALASGEAMWLSAGISIRRFLNEKITLDFGPNFIIGRVAAKGTFILNEGDSASHAIDFDGEGNGVGIGMNGSLLFAVGEKFRVGLGATVIYFGVKNPKVPLTGRNLIRPSEPLEYSHYDYRSEYIALSIRVIIGYEFRQGADYEHPR